MANNENRNTQQNQNKNPGNFTNNPQKTSEAGRKGGEHAHGSQDSMSGNKSQNANHGGRSDQNR